MNIVPIAAISDNKLSFALATLFINLMETKASDTFYELNAVVTPDFSQDNINKIKSIEKQYQGNCSVNVIVMDNRFDNIKNGTGYIANACAYKLILSEIFPKYKKIIYLDTDIIVFDDLLQLYNIDIEKKYISGVFSIGHCINSVYANLAQKLDIPNLLSYVNAGVLVFNLDEIRKSNIVSDMLALVGAYDDSVDQHIYNKICYGKIKLISPKYNVTATNDLFYSNNQALAAFTKKEIDETFNPVIYHYTGKEKPWNNSSIKYSMIWQRYYYNGPYKNIELKLKTADEIAVLENYQPEYTFLEKIFSVKNAVSNGKKYKMITILGIKIKILSKIASSYNTQNSDFLKLQKEKYKRELTISEKKIILEKAFMERMGYKPNIDIPKTFSEKIQYYKLHYKNPLLTKCADKVTVRDYIKEKIGEKYLVPIIGVYDSVDDIDFDKLPNQFALKVNWGSGQNIIVDDKSKLDINEAKEKLRNWMMPQNNNYLRLFEWSYKDIKPKIIVEKYITNGDDLYDYKFMCYHGIPKNMIIVSNRADKDKKAITFFDMDFNIIPVSRTSAKTVSTFKKPELWDEMIKISKILAKPFPFVRVDFYCIDGELKIGELTFYPGNGMEAFNPIEWDYKFGELLDVSLMR